MSEENFKVFPSINNNIDEKYRHYYDLTVSETLTVTADHSKRTLKTFAGVFCPVALAQFSSLLFLRLGFVIGQTGILLAILQLIMAYTILVLTVLSICAISTNGAVKGGGVYFMISRTLGPEVGGSIGILFFLANVFSSAFSVAGFVEGMTDNFGPEGRIHAGLIPSGVWWNYLFDTCVCLLCLALCLVGGSMFGKANLFIFIIVFICFLSVIVTFLFHPAMQVSIPRNNKVIYPDSSNITIMANYTGLSYLTFRKNLYYDHYDIDFTTNRHMDFLLVFPILFAGVTGIMNGANMSGELKDPGFSLPRGTLSAVAFTFIGFLITSLLTAATCDRFLLLNNYLYMQAVNFWKPFVMIGIFCTSLSAALGNLIGASRVLFALAKDDIFGILLMPAKKATKNGNPIAAVLISFVLVQIVLLIGKLNLIAPVMSVFFLLAYAGVNFACALLDMASASNFRPTFKFFSWHTSMCGVVCCLAMCFLVNSYYSIGIFVLFIALIIILNFRNLGHAWGSIGQALLYHQVRKYLLLIDVRKEHVKYWRPQILLLISNPRSQASLVQFVNLLKKGGLYVIGHVLRSNFEKLDKDPVPELQKNFVIMKDFLKVKAFVDITTASTIRDGTVQLVRLCGLGGMSINTVCLGFRDDSEPKDVLTKIKHQMNGQSTSKWPFPSRIVSHHPTQTDPLPPNKNVTGSLSGSSVNTVGTSQQQGSSFVSLNENSPLVSKKKFRRGTHIKMKYFSNILHSAIDSKFIDELPKVRIPNDNLINQEMLGAAPDTSLKENEISIDSMTCEQFSEQISEMEYVGIIADCIKLKKNICLCRHFQSMDMMDLDCIKSSESSYIDVWPINFFQPGSGSYLDKTCMFMLQLSCILGMSSKLNSQTKIRVHICLDYYSIVDSSNKNVKELWKTLLAQWRIKAEIIIVAWDDIIVNLESELGRNIISNNPSSGDTKKISSFDCNLPNTYIKEVNSIIKSHTSPRTTVCFVYLPDLPNVTDKFNWRKYINQLTILTNDLPPTVFVRGQHEVITAAL